MKMQAGKRLAVRTLALGMACAATATAQEVLPFPPTPSGSTAGLTMQDSLYKKRVEPKRLAEGAPNILIILMDNVGPGTPSTYGGEINTPTLDRVAKAGVSYNRFHSTAMCSPARAALLTGRNHTRVGNGQIAALANDFDGFSGTIPKSSATVAEVLKNYGYNTGAWGKWHNTPEEQITSKGPFDYWPTGYGFEYFYGFLAGEASQYEPQMVRNTTQVSPHELHREGYHLTEDIAEDAIKWLREQRAFAPDKPFLMYWAPGASHGPYQVMKQWADKYKHKFDDGWDAYRERVFKRAKEKGWIPQNDQLTPRPATMASWESIPEDERPFQRRLMEVFAGFTEHADYNAGRIIEEIERQGKLDNTLIFYIWGDNGSSAEGLNGSISEKLAQNGIPTKISQHLEALKELGGIDALGSPKTDNMYHAGWAWAGDTPFQYTKLIASHFGGTRTPLVISWPKGIKVDKTPRAQFHHVNDVVPTVYEILGIKPPQMVDGFTQDPIDGTSMVYTFAAANTPGRKRTQYFDNNGSRGIYHDGWYACTFGPLTPGLTVSPGLATWDANQDVWELYNLTADFSQAENLAATEPKRLAEMQSLFLVEAKENKVFPIGAGIWLRLHPEDRIKTPYTSWRFDATTTRMPEFTAPGLGRQSSHVTIEAQLGENASGVLYALGGASGGLSVFMDKGYLACEYNMMIIERYTARSRDRLLPGKRRIEVRTTFKDKQPLSPAEVVLTVDGQEVGSTLVSRTVPAAFTASETFDVGVDLGSPVSLDYFDRRPFRFNGTIDTVKISLE
jgi:arylsulfatase A-like enzyme